MRNYDAKWLIEQLSEHGALQRLADATGIDANKLSKVRTGVRQLKADELLKILDHYGMISDRPSELSDLEKALLEETAELDEEALRHLLASAKLFRGTRQSSPSDTDGAE